MGGVVPVDEAVVRTEHVFVGLRSVTAYSTGISLGLVLAVRRRGLGKARWDSLQDSFFTGLRPRGQRPDDEQALRIEVELADARRVRALYRGELGHFDPLPQSPVLVERSGAGMKGSDEMHRQNELWLWPLPDGDTLSLLLQWPPLTCR
jgi:hypothetical protein